MWLNHYAFQSRQHWELKKRRGRTNLLPSRRGNVPHAYEQVYDDSGHRLLKRRLQGLDRNAVLQACLSKLYLNLGAPT